MYGFNDMSSEVSKVENVLEEATAIREVIENIVKVKDEAIVRSLGIYYAATTRNNPSPVCRIYLA